MATFLTKVQAALDKPLVKRITGTLLEDAIPKLKARIGEDPIVALGGLATFLAWLAGKLPAKIAKPLQGIVFVLSIVGAKATVTPIAAPKVVVSHPIDPAVPAGPKVTVKVPLVPARAEVAQAVQSAVDKIKGAVAGAASAGAASVVKVTR